MQRHTLRLLIAVVTLCLGVCVSKTINFLEGAIVAHFYPVSEIHSVSVPTNDALDSNEIYNLILRDFKDSDLKLLVVQSESKGYDCSEYGVTKELDPQVKFSKTVQRFMPDVETETLYNYLDVNKVSGPLKISAPGLNVVMVPPPDFSGPFWAEFYETYPNSPGLIFFSQVAFNTRHDQAFVYVARACGGLCGGGSYILLGKKNGKWNILRKEGLWVS